MHQLIDYIAGQHAFRTIGDINLVFQFRTKREDQILHLVRSTYWGGRFYHIQITFFQQRNNCTGGRFHIRNIRLVISFEGSGNHHEISVTFLGSSGSFQLTTGHHFLKQFLHTGFYDMQFTLISHLNHPWIYIHTGDLYPVLCGNNSRGQANIAQPHKTCFHLLFYLKCD